jgi:hypothetical protein
MTKEEVEYIQAACRDWLQQPGTATGARKTISANGQLSRPVEVELKGILTFDNMRITSAVDAETGICYTKLIEQPDGVSKFFDTTFENIAPDSIAIHGDEPAPMRATQQRYHDAIQRVAADRSEADKDAQAIDPSPWWIEKAESDSDERAKYQLYTNGKLLGYSLLERARSDQRSGRFHPSEEYFEYADIFAALPQAENDCLEANAQEAYGIFDQENDGYRTRFAQLSALVDALELYVAEESGQRIEASEVRLEDLSHHYDDETERWLYVTINKEPFE